MNFFKNVIFKRLLILWLILIAWESAIFLLRLTISMFITYWVIKTAREFWAVRQFNKRAIENYRKIHNR